MHVFLCAYIFFTLNWPAYVAAFIYKLLYRIAGYFRGGKFSRILKIAFDSQKFSQ